MWSSVPMSGVAINQYKLLAIFSRNFTNSFKTLVSSQIHKLRSSGKHVTLPWHTILTMSYPVFDQTPKCHVLAEEAENTNLLSLMWLVSDWPQNLQLNKLAAIRPLRQLQFISKLIRYTMYMHILKINFIVELNTK